MAKFDVYRTAKGRLALDCQATTLDYLSTRLVVPLIPPGEAPMPAARLNPTFTVDGQDVVMVTQFAASLPTQSLGKRIARLGLHEYEIGAALDMLISGF